MDGKDGADGQPGEKGDKGDKGEPGQKGEQGIQGIPGKDGADGKDGANGKDGVSATHSWNGTTLTITSASGTSSANLKGEKGDKGDKGDQGIQGEKGATGATGAAGKDGADGKDGKDGAQGIQGIQGEQGPRGDKGDKGDTGATGKDGATFTPSISDGVLSWSNNGNLENPPDFDFAAISGSFNETDPTVPAWAKQPNKPSYTAAEVGALSADTVIPDGGIPIPNTASVGQTVVVKAVDENGKPTEWEAADFPVSGGVKTKIITIADFTFENDLVISVDDTDDINFGDAVVNYRHFFYLTPEGEQIKAKRIYGYIQPTSEIKIPASLCMSAYYRDGTPSDWGFGDFLGNNTGIIGLAPGAYTCKGGSSLYFEANLRPMFARSGVVASQGWEQIRFNGIAFKAIDTIIPHFSGVKIHLSSGSLVFPAGTRFVLKAEVEDNA